LIHKKIKTGYDDEGLRKEAEKLANGILSLQTIGSDTHASIHASHGRSYGKTAKEGSEVNYMSSAFMHEERFRCFFNLTIFQVQDFLEEEAEDEEYYRRKEKKREERALRKNNRRKKKAADNTNQIAQENADGNSDKDNSDSENSDSGSSSFSDSSSSSDSSDDRPKKPSLFDVRPATAPGGKNPGGLGGKLGSSAFSAHGLPRI
jgi:hypothetical protein